jgi:hypothetical protein
MLVARRGRRRGSRGNLGWVRVASGRAVGASEVRDINRGKRSLVVEGEAICRQEPRGIGKPWYLYPPPAQCGNDEGREQIENRQDARSRSYALEGRGGMRQQARFTPCAKLPSSRALHRSRPSSRAVHQSRPADHLEDSAPLLRVVVLVGASRVSFHTQTQHVSYLMTPDAGCCQGKPIG